MSHADTAARVNRYRLNAYPSRGDANDKIYSPPPGQVLPVSASLRDWRAPIRDQGEEGSCTAFTGRGIMEFLRNRKGHPYIELSPQQLYHNELIIENGSAHQDTGCQIRTIPKTLNKFGIASEASWPYTKKKFSTAITKKVATEALQYTAVEYLRVQDVYGLMYAIAVDKLAVMIGISCYASMMTDAVAANGVIPQPSRGDKMVGGHALCCDEYSHDEFGSGLYFTGPNSWDNDWGGANAAPSAAGAKRGLYHVPVSFIMDPACLSDTWIVRK